jgi:two-component system, LuxR family, sensor kinase FixL
MDIERCPDGSSRMDDRISLQPSKPQQLFLRFLHGGRAMVLLRAGVLTTVVALIDWRFDVNISFGFLYLFPMLMVGGYLARWQIALVAALYTGLCEAFGTFPWAPAVGIPRLILTFAAFFGTGLFVFEAARNRRLANQHLAEIEKEVGLRREAEEQLRFLIESSPATIFTLDGDGKVLLANDAAHRLLGMEAHKLEGQYISQYFPALAVVPPITADTQAFRTVMECRGWRQNGEVLLAHIWFSTYRTVSGPRLAAVVFDASEDLREREEFSLQQLSAASKILVGAVCHEIRNMCGAIAAVHAKLARNERLSRSEDFRALGSLVEGLGMMAGLELQQTRQPETESIDIHPVLEDLRIVIEPSFRESGISVRWEVPESLPPVSAEPQALLQAFLNITKNSQRAMENQQRKELTVRAGRDGNALIVRFIDSGHGIVAPDQLFKPFQPGANATGLGLYLSRAFVRAFQGDIKYEPRETGCCFAVVLTPVWGQPDEPLDTQHGENPPAAARRSHTLPREPQPAARQ